MAAVPVETVVLLHGLWVTPHSWTPWRDHLAARGVPVLAPGYPGLDRPVAALRADPGPVARLDLAATVEHLAAAVRALPTPPLIVGHDLGGLLAQVLAARGLGAAAVAIAPVPPPGIRVNPLTPVRSLLPRRPGQPVVELDAGGFHRAVANTCTPQQARRDRERHVVPAPTAWLAGYGLFARHGVAGAAARVDPLARRTPLLLLAGEQDRLVPPAAVRSAARHYRHSPAVTDFRVLPGRDHWTCLAPGWERVAELVLDWARRRARAGSVAAAG